MRRMVRLAALALAVVAPLGAAASAQAAAPCSRGERGVT